MASENSKPKTIKFDYVKSNHFRVIHVDGAHGGVTGNGLIQMALYNERMPIPQSTVQAITPENTLGDELSEARVVRQAIVREVEVEALMDLNTATALLKWLTAHVATLEARLVKREEKK